MALEAGEDGLVFYRALAEHYPVSYTHLEEPRHLDKDPAGARCHLHERKPDRGLPLHDVLGSGEHG